VAFKFSGTNFQCWENFEFEANGLTVLVGDSNEGKSSLSRALKGLVRNELGAYFIRNGTKKMSVSLEIDGKTYTASRTKSGSTKYVVNPGEEKYESVGTDVPEPVQKLGLTEIRIGKDVFDPIFATQGDPQFLLQEKPAPLNAILGAFSSTEKLEGGKREAHSRTSRLNTEAAMLAEHLQQAEAMKAKLAALTERGGAIQAAIDTLTPVIERQEAVIAVLDVLITDRTRLNQIKALAERIVVPKTRHLEVGLQQVVWLQQATTLATKAKQLSGTLARLPVSDTLKLTAGAAKAHHLTVLIPARQKLETGTKWFARVETVIETWTAIVGQYKLVKALDEAHTRRSGTEAYAAKTYTEKLDSRLKAIRKGLGEIERLRQQGKAALELEQALQAAVKGQSEVTTLTQNLAATREREAAIAQELTTQREREYRLAHEITCPGCGEHFIPNEEGEHSHAISGNTTAGSQAGAGRRPVN